jgi:tripartite-type tricarboxylate transporter receptor subunit TctC
MPHLRAGTIKAFAVTAASRLAAAPDIPTVDEAGAPGLHAATWFGLWAPKGTPGSIVATLNAALVASLAEPAVRERLTDLAYDIFPREQQTPQAHAAFHQAETDKWWPLIRSAGIRE